ncbi:uncharacterized protein LOC128724372 [Anopheles nili]|uniref:uncharacterized protein LOC128724372 n=1 Tax=Anopheles nili TaxID=185578 RepID=UPI00237BA294|nr:uncharacterized protein LOC128724372 [Anopheles nili]
MANKARKDGVDFQQHLFYYIIGLNHNRYNYSILYEGNDKFYGALDDVILRIHPEVKSKINEGFYLFQAKQTIDNTFTMSIQDLLHYKVNVTKYIDSYKTFKESKARNGNELPTEMIYWTSYDFHKTSKAFIEEHFSKEPHLDLNITEIKKYKISHWKALFMFDTAQNLAQQCTSKPTPKKETPKHTYLCSAVVQQIMHEILEVANQTDPVDLEKKSTVRFREQFLSGAESLSKNATAFRKSFQIACQMCHFTDLPSDVFTTDIIDLNWADNASQQSQSGLQYNGLGEDELNWFFDHFIFYVNVPKGEPMLEAINDVFNGQFNEKLFEKYLLKKPQSVAQSARQGKQQPDIFITKPFVNALLEMIHLQRSLTAPSLKCVEFKQQSLNHLDELIQSALHDNVWDLCIIAKPKVEWTVARIAKLNKSSILISNSVDFNNFLRMLTELRSIELGESLIDDVVQIVVLTGIENMPLHSKQILEQLPNNAKVISIIPNTGGMLNNYIEDDVKFDDVSVDYDQLEVKHLTIDAKNIAITNLQSANLLDCVEQVVELSLLKGITVKSDTYAYDEEHYIERQLIDESGNEVSTRLQFIDSTPTVSVICDTAGQGKTIELLRIAKETCAVPNTVCLYFRARTIATKLSQNEHTGVPNTLLNLLHITPRSALVDNIVMLCFKHVRVCLLVDGFDEIVEKYQHLVIVFLQEIMNETNWSILIATRTESKPVLTNAFKTASLYHLGKFSYVAYFKRLWLNEKVNPSSELIANVHIFLSSFDVLLKSAGCKSFLEVPQLCKIMGSIYQERIAQPNIQLHTNYAIGSIYDTFVQSQFENTVRGRFDDTDKLVALAKELLKAEFYAKHMQLAYELEYYTYKQLLPYENFTPFGLIMVQIDSSDSILFTHRTVMEYFLVRCCMLDDIADENFFAFLERYFCVSRVNIADKFIDFFLADANCLKCNKKQIIQSYLLNIPNHLATCIRITLNNATFNTLKLLLSISPKSRLNNLCFRFGATQSMENMSYVSSAPNEINLKRLGERQLILLLEALNESDKASQSDYDHDEEKGYCDESLLKRMLFETESTEEDALEVAIRKPFPVVFDWIVSYCEKHPSPHIENYILARLPRYAGTLIRHCGVEKNGQIIDKIRELCLEKLDHDTVRKYLQSFDLLYELVNSIETVPQGKKFIEKDRIYLLEKVIEICDWYIDTKLLTVMKTRASDQIYNLQNVAIKCRLIIWINNTSIASNI